MTRTLSMITVATTLLFAAACEPAPQSPDASAYVDALPDERVLVNLPTEGGFRAVGDLSEYYLWSAEATTNVNGFIGEVLTQIDHITDFDPTWSEDEARFLWGPWSDGGLDPNETVLYIEHDAAAETYAWVVAQRLKGSTSDDDWVPMFAGEAVPGATEDTGEGWFVVDFDNIASMNPTEETTGRFATHYVLEADMVTAEASFEAFSDDPAAPAVNAVYAYGQDALGAGWMDLGFENDVVEGGELEVTVLRSRWQADGQGRGDAYVFGGDLEPLTYTATECWDNTFSIVYEENNAEMHMEGDETLCVFDEPEFNEDGEDAS